MPNARGPLADLLTCDNEPITRLDCIQNFGFLLALANDWTVIRASANLGHHLGIDAALVIGSNFAAAIAPGAQAAIRNSMAMLYLTDNERLFGIRLVEDRPLFDLNLHFVHDVLVIEGEVTVGDNTGEAAAMVRSMMTRLGRTPALDAFHRLAARQVRELTGFDRVMVYRFDPVGNGEVIAEASGPGIETFLGLHYPASDIPQQARALYLRNSFRIISDVAETPVPLLPLVGANVPALDLSQSITRAVSPVHIEYLTNMGVGATLSISIIVGGELWGLFACHHYAPRLPSFVRRTAAELFGGMYCLALESRLGRESALIERRARLLSDRLIAGVAANEKLLYDPEWLDVMMCEMVDYDGLAVYRDGDVLCLRSAPSCDQVTELALQLNLTSPSQVFTSDHVASLFTWHAAGPAKVVGVLAIPISRMPRDYILLFRRERLQSIQWGGEPGKSSVREAGFRLSPRKSFAAFSETIRGKSKPFSEGDRRVGEAVRSAMVEVILRLSAASIAALAAEVEARRLVEREVFGLNEQFETRVVERTRDLVAANGQLVKKMVVSAAALRSSRADAKSGRVDLLASETALAAAQVNNNARLVELVASETALVAARAETELRDADLQVSKTALASSQAEKKLGAADLRASITALETSRAENRVGVADLLASAVDLASSRAETKAGQIRLYDSEGANKTLTLANHVLGINEAALEALVGQRTAALRSEINTRRIMATAVAHELNQPLTAISSYLNSTARLAERGDMDRETLALIVDGSRRAASQAMRAGEILKLLRNSIMRDDTVMTLEDIGFIVDETIAVAQAESDRLGIVFRFDQPARRMTARVNRTQIRQVLINLIQNAVEAVSGTSRRDVTVTVALMTDTALLTIDVADTGPGVLPTQLEGLFTPFVSSKPHGMGIGLSISREIIEQHQGRLTTRDNPGGGAIFTVTLPSGDALAPVSRGGR